MNHKLLIFDLTNGKEIKVEPKKDERIEDLFKRYHNSMKEKETIHLSVEDKEIVLSVKSIVSMTMQ